MPTSTSRRFSCEAPEIVALIRHHFRRLGVRFFTNAYEAKSVRKDASAFWRRPGFHVHVQDGRGLIAHEVHNVANLPALLRTLQAIPTPAARAEARRKYGRPRHECAAAERLERPETAERHNAEYDKRLAQICWQNAICEVHAEGLLTDAERRAALDTIWSLSSAAEVIAFGDKTERDARKPAKVAATSSQFDPTAPYGSPANPDDGVSYVVLPFQRGKGTAA